MHFAIAHLEEDAECVIDLEEPEAKTAGILPGETMGEPRGSRHFQIVKNNDRVDWSLVHRKEERMLALRRIRRAIHEDESRLSEM